MLAMPQKSCGNGRVRRTAPKQAIYPSLDYNHPSCLSNLEFINEDHHDRQTVFFSLKIVQ